MSEENSSVDALIAGDGKTSDQMLAEIEAIKSNSTSTSSAKPEVNTDSAPQSEDVPDKASGKQLRTEPVSEGSDDEPVPQGEDTRYQGKTVEVNEWMKKKGFRSVEDMAKSLRSLEQELSRRGGKTLDETRPMQPDPVITTRSQYIQPQHSSVEELAKRYNLPPEDFERVMPLINDATDLKLRMAVTPLANEIQRLNSELRKKASNEELERDPTFKNRAVMQEIYQIMESDPSVQNAPEPLKVAYEKALINMGRRFVEGMEDSGSSQETRSEVPTTPPPLGKSGQGTPKGSHMKTIMGKMTPEKFNSLSSAEMEKYLSQQGKVRHETF